MPKVDVYDMKGKKVSDVELAESIFGIEPNEAIVHSVSKLFSKSTSRYTKY